VKKLGIDLDGVVCKFTEAFLKRANEELGREVKPDDQTNWDFDQHFTQAEVSHLWDIIRAERNFWTDLRPEEGTSRLWHCRRGVELVFVTSRVATRGSTPQEQSAYWLRQNFGISLPYVIVVPDPSLKAAVAKALQIEAFIDDKPETVLEMHDAGIRSYLRKQPYNNHREYPEGVRVVASLDEFLLEEAR
jgi:uncharacterized HAD superfamily protein